MTEKGSWNRITSLLAVAIPPAYLTGELVSQGFTLDWLYYAGAILFAFGWIYLLQQEISKFEKETIVEAKTTG